MFSFTLDQSKTLYFFFFFTLLLHLRAWIPNQNCYLLSEESPVVTKKVSAKLNAASKEIKIHVDLIRELFGSFEYMPPKTTYQSGMCVLNNVQVPTQKSPQSSPQKPPPVRVLKPLSGKPAAFMNGIREAEEAEKNDKEEIKVSVNVGGQSRDEEVTKTESENVSVVDEEDYSMDSMSQDSTAWSMASSFSSEKHDAAVRSVDSQDVDEVKVEVQQKSRMGGGRVGAGKAKVSRMATIMSCSRIVEDTSGDALTKISEISRSSGDDSGKTPPELTRKQSVTSEDSPSKGGAAAPVGVFEISDESLDIDKDKLGKSPAVQLLGKVHVSPKSLMNRNLGLKTESPLKDGKTDVGNETKSNDLKSESERSMTAENAEKSSPQSAISADGKKVKASSLQSILPSKLPDPSNLDEADITPKTPPEADTPSTSKVTPPRSSDKFHMNLTKTIESMKARASLGMDESMEDNEDSDTSSDTASMSGHDSDGDSDSSEEESSMEVDVKNGEATEKGKDANPTDGEEDKPVSDDKVDDDSGKTEEDAAKMTEEDAVKNDGGNDDDISKDTSSSADGEESKDKGEEVTRSDVKDQGSEAASLSDCGPAMSVHSADDQSENELVIDMDRVEEDLESTREAKDTVTTEDITAIKDDDKTTDSDEIVTEATEKTSSSPSRAANNTDNPSDEMSRVEGALKMPPKMSASPAIIQQQILNMESQTNNPCNNEASVCKDVIEPDANSDENNAKLVISEDASVIETHETPMDLPQVASQELSEIAMQSKPDVHQSASVSEAPGDSSSPAAAVPMETSTTEEKMEVDVTTVASKNVDDEMETKDEDKVGENKTVDKEEESKGEEDGKKGEEDSGKRGGNPWPDEDPLKAWGTADDLLNKYSTEVS